MARILTSTCVPSRRLARLWPVGALLWATACSHVRPLPLDGESTASGRVLDATDIQKMNARDAWGVLRSAGVLATFSESSRGEPIRLRGRRGRSSFVVSQADELVLVLDGVRITDVDRLRVLPASALTRVEIIGGREATTRFGTNAGAGAVLLTTTGEPELLAAGDPVRIRR